jgi:hypothetical protein
MKVTDRFLVGIVAGVVLLVGVAFAVAFLRPEPEYRPDDTPEGVTHNYLLALRQYDYARAHGYLSPRLPGYPANSEEFAQDVRDNSYNFDLDDRSVTLEVESARLTGNTATVTVRRTVFYGGGLFDSSEYSGSFDVRLRREGGGWKIVEAGQYWAYCWGSRGC